MTPSWYGQLRLSSCVVTLSSRWKLQLAVPTHITKTWSILIIRNLTLKQVCWILVRSLSLLSLNFFFLLSQYKRFSQIAEIFFYTCLGYQCRTAGVFITPDGCWHPKTLGNGWYFSSSIRNLKGSCRIFIGSSDL